MRERALARALLALGVAAFALSSAACPTVVDTDPTGGSGGTGGTGTTSETGSTSTTPEPPQKVDKVDVLFAIDNSRGMADKQVILSLAVRDLVTRMANPACVDPATGQFVSFAAGPFDECPDGSQREYAPVTDIHIGVVSSSLGGHGSDACPSSSPTTQTNNDKGHLLARLDPTAPGEVETYQNLKFLAWDPAQKLAPPGEADVDQDSAADANATALVPSLRDMVLGVGQIGCGYESQLESWYRFLIDPTPPENVTLDSSGNVLLEGLDEVLLDQRKAFLRSNSALAIVMITDENDCSIMESKQFYYVAQLKSGNGQAFHLPKARVECETNPGDECCFSCGQKGPTDGDGNPTCPTDPSCKTADGKLVYLDDLTDHINLRCFRQKQRFGIDFLYPIERYVSGLTEKAVTDRNGQVVPNPIFSDLDPSDGVSEVRPASSVILAGIVGVPWQDIARHNGSGVPDLIKGLDGNGAPAGGFKSAAELGELLPGKEYNTWDLILGDHAKYGLPKDPLMVDSIWPRTEGLSSNPITGDPIVTSSQPLANKINGHEWSIPKRDDLQFACIFPLVKVDDGGNVFPDVRDCSVPGLASCDCEDKSNDSPLCQVNPATGEPTNQVMVKAYPGLRHLAVLKGLGPQGVVASVCPAQLVDPSDSNFGYRPAMTAVLERLKLHFE